MCHLGQECLVEVNAAAAREVMASLAASEVTFILLFFYFLNVYVIWDKGAVRFGLVGQKDLAIAAPTLATKERVRFSAWVVFPGLSQDEFIDVYFGFRV